MHGFYFLFLQTILIFNEAWEAKETDSGHGCARPGDTMVTGPTPNTLVIVWFLSRFSLETQSVKAWYMDWTWVRV